jgi:hypothetical protein
MLGHITWYDRLILLEHHYIMSQDEKSHPISSGRLSLMSVKLKSTTDYGPRTDGQSVNFGHELATTTVHKCISRLKSKIESLMAKRVLFLLVNLTSLISCHVRVEWSGE